MSPLAQFLFNTVNDSNRVFLSANPTEFSRATQADLHEVLGDLPPSIPTPEEINRMAAAEEEKHTEGHVPRHPYRKSYED